MPDPATITMVDPHGVARDIPVDQVEAARMQGFVVEGHDQRAARIATDAKEDAYGTPLGKVGAFAAGFNRAVTFGASDAIGTAIDPEQARHYRNLREVNPGASMAGEITGGVVTAIPTGGNSALAQALARTPGGMVTQLGARIAQTGEGAGALTKVARAAAGFGTEGVLVGAGQGVSELALSDEKLTFERVAATLSSNALYGGAIGAGTGVFAKSLEVGLGRAKGAIDDFRAGREAREAIQDDIAQMDVKQLRAARDAELESIKATQKAEVEAAETARAADRQVIADEITAYRREIRSQNHALTTKDVNLPTAGERWGSKELGRVAKDTDRQLDRLLNNPIALAKEPSKSRAALNALQQQENVFVKMLERGDELRAAYGTGELAAKRMAALDTIPAALEKNRALQARIESLHSPIKPTTPDVTPRLSQIDEARELLAAGKGEKTIAEQMLQGSVFSGVAGLTSAVPVVGPMLAPFLGARASKLVGEQVFGRVKGALNEQAKRGAAALSKFIEKSERVVKVAPPIATRVLNAVRFGESTDKRADHDLPTAFKARSAELRSQVMYASDGSLQMRPEARAAVADRLAPIRAVDPIAADRLETKAALRITYLASKLPRRPDVAGAPLAGVDRWRPSDLEMRTFARIVAAVEDPLGVIERLAHGHVTHEDAEAIRTVYPELHAEFSRQLIAQLPALRDAPYHKRLALSIFSGVPVDPALDPQILRGLQEQYSTEEGTDGGQHAPMASAQFGSVKSHEKATPAQERAS